MVVVPFRSVVQPTKRSSSDGARVSRDAIALVRPFNEQMGAWQAEAVRLAVSAERGRSTGRYDAGVAEAITTLLDYLAEHETRFEAVVAAADEKVRVHSRVADTRTAFGMVARRLKDALPKP